MGAIIPGIVSCKSIVRVVPFAVTEKSAIVDTCESTGATERVEPPAVAILVLREINKFFPDKAI